MIPGLNRILVLDHLFDVLVTLDRINTNTSKKLSKTFTTISWIFTKKSWQVEEGRIERGESRTLTVTGIDEDLTSVASSADAKIESCPRPSSSVPY